MKPKHRKFPLNYSNKSNINPKKIYGLKNYANSLEKIFYADVSLKCKSEDSKSSIEVTINCNYNIAEALFQLKESNWGSLYGKKSMSDYSPFKLTLFNLQQKNTSEIILNELAIHFKDTSLYISKIENHSIQNQLYDILNTLSGNFIYLTKGLSESPYEIFIPVFEEPDTENKSANRNKHSYYKYWGIYYHSDEYKDCMVYDLKTKTIIANDLSLIYNE